MPDERRTSSDAPRVNNARSIAFTGLGHHGPQGDITVKRFATTLLVAGLLATPMLVVPPAAEAHVSIGISIGIAPPVMPVYAQPVIPGPGYIWTPGYWAWDSAYNNYYWVPGTWVMPPMVGLLWTPGWWGWESGYYRWHGGYWGHHVGFYGGVNYGFGYFGSGYSGGYWRGRNFFYNRAVSNVNVTNIRNVYVDKTVINNVHVNRVSYNGGHGGLTAQPSMEQRGWAKERRYDPTSMQVHQRTTAMSNPGQRFNANQAHPAVYATQHPGHFDGPHAVRAEGVAKSQMATAPGRPTMMKPSTTGNRGYVQAPRKDTSRGYPIEHGSNAYPIEHGNAATPRPQSQRGYPIETGNVAAPRNADHGMRMQGQSYREAEDMHTRHASPRDNGFQQPQRAEPQYAAPRQQGNRGYAEPREHADRHEGREGKPAKEGHDGHQH